jgi:hypothetical protein
MFAWLQSIYQWVFASHALLVQIRVTQLTEQKQLDAIQRQLATFEKTAEGKLDSVIKNQELANQKLDQLIDLLASHDVTDLNITVDKPVKQ